MIMHIETMSNSTLCMLLNDMNAGSYVNLFGNLICHEDGIIPKDDRELQADLKAEADKRGFKAFKPSTLKEGDTLNMIGGPWVVERMSFGAIVKKVNGYSESYIYDTRMDDVGNMVDVEVYPC